MVTAIPTHKFIEMINKTQTWIKTGEVSLFWGLIKFPQGRAHEEIVHTGRCLLCGEMELTQFHGFFSLKG